MDFRKLPAILAILLLTVLIVQPVLSANYSVTSYDLEKDAATGLYNSGDTLVVKGDYENAIMLFDLALASNTTMLNKTDAILYLYRDKAYAQIQLERYTDAIATVDTGLALYPSDAMLWNNKGYALDRLGKTQDALTAYDKSVSFDRNYTTAHINRGDVLSQMGRYTEAREAYLRANETDPFNAAAAEGLEAATKGGSESSRNLAILLAIVLIVAAGIGVWYVKFRKPAEPEPEEQRTKSQKK